MNMDFPELKRFLWSTGHFRNPAQPKAWEVDKSDLPKLKQTDPAFRAAIASYQTYFGFDLQTYTLALHGRAAMADGDIGPATDIILNAPRCAMPDFEVPEEDDPELHKLWNREDASWPSACRGNLVAGRSFKNLPGLTEADTIAVFWAGCHMWSEALSDLQMTPGEVGKKAGSHFYAGLEKMGGGTLAWSYLARDSCAVQLAQAYNSGMTWNRRMATTVMVHECGHALGLGHNSHSQATMYPSIHQYSQGRFGYPHEADIAAIAKLGYKPHPDWATRQPKEEWMWLPRGTTDPSAFRPEDWLDNWWLK
jgi:hypothetical protein